MNRPPEKPKVGYGNPPKEHQFKKGDGRPRLGRTKGSGKKSAFQEAMARRIPVTDNGKKITLTVKEAVLAQLTHKALVEKDLPAIKLLLGLMKEAGIDITKGEDGYDHASPQRSPFTIIHISYEAQAMIALGVCTEDHYTTKLCPAFAELAFSLMSQEQIAELDFDQLKHTLEDPSILERYRAWPRPVTPP